jgi:ATP-dependent Clp protease ATP-binding subunit ClpA
MFERFTDQAHRAVAFAQEEARQLNHDHVGTEHVLAGLLREDRGAAAQVLEASGVDLQAFRTRVIAETESRPEGLEYTPTLRVRQRARRTVMSDPVQALLDSIDGRLSAIERHLGMDSGGPGNVIPPS